MALGISALALAMAQFVGSVFDFILFSIPIEKRGT